MEPKYATLKTIYEIVKHESNPITYHCNPTQIILRQLQPWDNIMQQLNELAAEELITVQPPANTICITVAGIEKARLNDMITHS